MSVGGCVYQSVATSCIGCCELYIHAPIKELILCVLQRRDEVIAVSMSLPEHDILPYTRLYVFVDVGIFQTE